MNILKIQIHETEPGQIWDLSKPLFAGLSKTGPRHLKTMSEISKSSRSFHSGRAHIKFNCLESCRVERCGTPIVFLMGWMAISGQNCHFFGPPQPVHGGPLLLSTRGGGIGRSKGPCDVFDPWVRWERGQVGI